MVIELQIYEFSLRIRFLAARETPGTEQACPVWAMEDCGAEFVDL